jgi:fructose-bisphosphate aldolase/2-amino-3,7-dideoxy-D-threo-hept-6-ulosonate synthase
MLTFVIESGSVKVNTRKGVVVVKPGKEIRLARIFNPKSKRMVLITLDHGICINPMMELSDMEGVLRKVVAGGPDVILLTPGMAKHFYRPLVEGKVSLMLRIDGTATSIGPDLTNDELICSVENALRLGADAVATFGVIGVPREAQLSHKNGFVAEACDLWGMPLMIEMIPADILEHQFADRAERKWPKNPEVVKYSARVAAELGADIVKGYYTGDKDSFKEVINYCPVPYVVLSGPASGDPQVLLQFIRDAMDCGAAGVSMGRNVWAYKDPTALVRAIRRIVHDDASVEEAMKEIG